MFGFVVICKLVIVKDVLPLTEVHAKDKITHAACCRIYERVIEHCDPSGKIRT